jgi:hypothetical protein
MSDFVGNVIDANEGEVMDKICRYCFGGEDEGALISPCKVIG